MNIQILLLLLDLQFVFNDVFNIAVLIKYDYNCWMFLCTYITEVSSKYIMPVLADFQCILVNKMISTLNLLDVPKFVVSQS